MTPGSLDFLSELVRVRVGIVLKGEKAFMAETRLGPLARREGLESVEALLIDLRQSRDERLAKAVVEAMTLAETSFFRDPAVFSHIRDVILPALAAARPDGMVRVWCAGCSTGQEAYSIAMLALQAQAAAPNLKIDIIGTDISHRALEKAHSGIFTQFEVQRGLPIRLLLEHFEKAGDTWRVSDRLKQAVRWRQLNLLEDRRSVRAFDLVLCRNVVRYFEPETAKLVLEQMAPALAPDGRLVLGMEETLTASAFEPAESSIRVYRRKRQVSQAAA